MNALGSFQVAVEDNYTLKILQENLEAREVEAAGLTSITCQVPPPLVVNLARATGSTE